MWNWLLGTAFVLCFALWVWLLWWFQDAQSTAEEAKEPSEDA